MIPTRTLAAIAAACALFAGCDSIPTEPPILEQRWILPVDETTLSVDQLLPEAVSVTGDTWDVAVDPTSAEENLGVLCADCGPLDGLTAPVPAFAGDFSSEQGLPDDVVAAEVTVGSMDLTVRNGFSFDPLENGGTVTISITDDDSGALLGQVELAEGTHTLPPGSVTQLELELEPGTVTGAMRVTVDVDAPGGMVAPIDVTEELVVEVAVTSLGVGSLTVNVQERSVSLDEKTLDLEDIDGEITERIVAGGVILDVDNPFGVSIDGAIDIGATSKAFSIAGDDASSVELQYSGDELRSFIGQPGVTLTGQGTANGTGITIAPGQVLTLDAKLDFTLEIG